MFTTTIALFFLTFYIFKLVLNIKKRNRKEKRKTGRKSNRDNDYARSEGLSHRSASEPEITNDVLNPWYQSCFSCN